MNRPQPTLPQQLERQGLDCPGCSQPMRAVQLEAHYERLVEVDLCMSCRLVWFDRQESLNLSGLGWIELLDRMQHREPAAHAWAGQPLGCARCARPLQPRHNQTRYGHFVSNACADGHGALQSQAMLLAERGFVRAPTLGERSAMTAEGRTWTCLNCGAPLTSEQEPCAWCKTPVLMVDLPRLADSLRPQARHRDTVSDGRLDAWACQACGQALDPTMQSTCPHCGHLVVVPTVAELAPLLTRLRQQWQAWLLRERGTPSRPSQRPAVAITPTQRQARRRDGPPWKRPVTDWLPFQLWLGLGVILAVVWAWVLA